MERQNAPKFIGNSLQRPSLLIHPLEHTTTVTDKQEAAKGDRVEQRKMGDVSAQNYQSLMQKSRRHDDISVRPDADRSSLEFVGETATILANLQPDGDGRVRVSRDELMAVGNHNLVRIVAMDREHVAIRSFVLENAREVKEDDLPKIKEHEVMAPVFPYRDTRLFPGLDIETAFVEQREIAILSMEDEEFTINDYLTVCTL